MLNLGSLNPQQRLAVETTRGPVLILAGAGTGKTRVITHRIAYLIQRGVSPGNILAVTFTNKAAREMKARVIQLIPRKSRASRSQTESGQEGSETQTQPTVCTFHSLCTRILRRHIEKLGYKRNFVIYDESEQLSTIKKILSRISAKGEKTDPSAILALLSKFKNGGSRASVFADESVRAMAQHIRNHYESALRACNAVDFDDLILLTLRLFKEHPEALESCRAQYAYVMVDEYQDTNSSQFELVHDLTKAHRNLCVVGDDDQSIYGWRGAEIANLLDMEQHFPEVKVIKLEQNYRSTHIILSAANALIKNNVRRRGKQLWSQNTGGSKISLNAYGNDEEEARGIVEQIEHARMIHRIPWNDQAILFRTNIQSRPLETALRQANVRYHLIGGQSFFDRREIRDFLAFLKVFLNPDDDVSLLRIANVPARGLSDVTMERLLGASHERKGSVYSVMKNPTVTATFQPRTRECIEAFVALIENGRTILSEKTAAVAPGQWSGQFLTNIGYFEELKRAEKTPEASENRIRNLKDLLVELDARPVAERTPLERIEEFLEQVSLDSDREEEDESPGMAVTLITMHSCKGLEFPHVYVAGLENGLLPHSRSKEEGTLDEERRLFYVAITRAMKSLSLSHCESRKKYGQFISCHPSPFLNEIPGELVETEDALSKKPVAVETGRSFFDALREVI